MSKQRKRILNPETLMVEFEKPSSPVVLKILAVTAGGALLFGLYLLLYLGVFHFTLPKTAVLQRQLSQWEERMERLGNRMDGYEEDLALLQVRDNRIYRPVFGMREMPDSLREKGDTPLPEGVEGLLASTMLRSERILRLCGAQSLSYDQVERLSVQAGDMASHLPAIPPINPDPRTYRYSSPFGYRNHPILGGVRLHKGVDLGCDRGNPIYCTGDGVVEMVKEENRSYGKQVLVNHGFGYHSRYAHMSEIFVFEGMKLKRGDCVGLSGNTGQSTAPHLHYEVLYNGEAVDPLHFMDLSIPVEEYFDMVRKPSVKKK